MSREARLSDFREAVDSREETDSNTQSNELQTVFSVFSVQLANSLHPQEVRPGIAVTTVTGTLVTKDNRYTLEPLNLTGEEFEKAM